MVRTTCVLPPSLRRDNSAFDGLRFEDLVVCAARSAELVAELDPWVPRPVTPAVFEVLAELRAWGRRPTRFAANRIEGSRERLGPAKSVAGRRDLVHEYAWHISFAVVMQSRYGRPMRDKLVEACQEASSITADAKWVGEMLVALDASGESHRAAVELLAAGLAAPVALGAACALADEASPPSP